MTDERKPILRLVDSRLAATPELDAETRAGLEDARTLDDAVRRAMDRQLEAAPPAPLAGAVRAGFRRRRVRRRLAWALPAAAAALVLLAGLAALDLEADRRAGNAVAAIRAERASDLALLAGSVQEVLETRESGVPVTYRNDRTGTRITLEPLRTWQSESGHWCRAFVERVGRRPDGGPAALSVACRDRDGVWKRVRSEIEGAEPAPWTALTEL